MAQKTIQGNQVLARQIRSRRSELGLTIEEASSRAGVGTNAVADMKPWIYSSTEHRLCRH